MYAILSLIVLFADGEGSGSPAPDGGGGPSLFNPIFLIPILFIFLWLFLLRPGQKRREREQQSMIANLSKNDKVITNAGIVAIVHSVVEGDEVVLKLEDNAKMRILKSTIFRNVSAEERTKAAVATPPVAPATTPETTDQKSEAIKEKK